MVPDDAGHDDIDSSTTSSASKDTSGSRNNAQDASDLLKGFEYPINLSRRMRRNDTRTEEIAPWGDGLAYRRICENTTVEQGTPETERQRVLA